MQAKRKAKEWMNEWMREKEGFEACAGISTPKHVYDVDRATSKNLGSKGCQLGHKL